MNLFAGWYRALGFNGCSSHSGRRGFITNAARKIGAVGGSLRDVQLLAGHSSLSTTQRYIEAAEGCARPVTGSLPTPCQPPASALPTGGCASLSPIPWRPRIACSTASGRPYFTMRAGRLAQDERRRPGTLSFTSVRSTHGLKS